MDGYLCGQSFLIYAVTFDDYCQEKAGRIFIFSNLLITGGSEDSDVIPHGSAFFSVELVEDDHSSDDMTVIWSAEEGRGGQVAKKGARRQAGADYSAVISKILVTFVPLSSSTAAANRKTPF